MVEAKLGLPSKLFPHILFFLVIFSFEIHDREEEPDFGVGGL